MKIRSRVSSQILILGLAGLVIVLTIQVAQAQNFPGEPGVAAPSIAQSISNQSQVGAGLGEGGQGQILKIDMPQKNWGQKIIEKTSLNYYQQFLGPTAAGRGSETYNVFQEAMDAPGTGRAPLQSFHAANIRYQINNSWATGVSLAATSGYTDEVRTRVGTINSGETTFFNARAFVVAPGWTTRLGTLFSTISYEAPTSSISRNQGMNFGWVLTESFAFRLPNPSWSAGIMGQYYRAYYNQDRNVMPPQSAGFLPTPLQTVIISGGPYVNYRFNDFWQLSSLITLDWDQRGVQTDSREFNNNLPHRGRIGMTYFPQQLKFLSSIGLFSQALLKFRPETTAFGAEFAMRF
jgi:hypothetical protein